MRLYNTSSTTHQHPAQSDISSTPCNAPQVAGLSERRAQPVHFTLKRAATNREVGVTGMERCCYAGGQARGGWYAGRIGGMVSCLPGGWASAAWGEMGWGAPLYDMHRF